MKILYPDGRATAAEVEELLGFAMECRRRVREHLVRIDDTFARHDFAYRAVGGGAAVVARTVEEVQYPTFAAPRGRAAGVPNGEDERRDPPADVEGAVFAASVPAAPVQPAAVLAPEPASVPRGLAPQPGHVVVPENTKGWSYRRLFAPYLVGARSITVRDPYVRLFFQARNVMEFCRMVHDLVPEGDEVSVRLVTQYEAETGAKQAEHLDQIAAAFVGSRVAFAWEVDTSPNFHARSIVTDTGWKIAIDRGLDLFQRYDGGAFSLELAMQEARLMRGVEVTYVRRVS